MMHWMRWTVPALIVLLGLGCDATAPTALSAADAIERIAQETERTVREYHAEVAAADDDLEEVATAAFVSRVVRAAGDEAALSKAQSDFRAAMRKVRADRVTEMERYLAARDNVGALREIGKGLRKIGLEALSLTDEMRRYITSWVELREQRVAQEVAETAARDQTRREATQGLLGAVMGALPKQSTAK